MFRSAATASTWPRSERNRRRFHPLPEVGIHDVTPMPIFFRCASHFLMSELRKCAVQGLLPWIGKFFCADNCPWTVVTSGPARMVVEAARIDSVHRSTVENVIAL